MTRPGEVSERIVTWPGVTEITIGAGGHLTIQGTPRMRLLLDGTAIYTWPLAAGRDWVAQEYVARVRRDSRWPTPRSSFMDLLRLAGCPGGPARMGGDIRLTRLPGAA